MRIINNYEATQVGGGDGVEFINDYMRNLGADYAAAVDQVQTKMNELGAEVKYLVMQAAYT